MKLSHQLLACAYPFLQVAKKLPTRIQPYTPHRLRILLYHDIAPHDLTRFATQLRWISNRWKFVSPEKFGDLMKGNAPLEGDNLLLTFDDGFIMAIHVLKMELKGRRRWTAFEVADIEESY